MFHVSLVGCSKYGVTGMATRPCMILYISIILTPTLNFMLFLSPCIVYSHENLQTQVYIMGRINSVASSIIFMDLTYIFASLTF